MSSTKKLFQNLRDRHGSPSASLAMTLLKNRTTINEPLALHTYIKLGGPADFFTVVKNADELAGAVAEAEKAGIRWFILGGGSNILVGDLGFRGLVIKNEADGLACDGLVITAESGILMSKLAAFANDKGLAGLEMFMSLPGTLGGAIFNNSHYRPEKNEFIGNLVESAEIMTFGESHGADPRYHFLDTLGSGSSLTASSPLGQSRSRGLLGSSSIVSKMTSSDQPVIVSRSWFRFGYDYSRLQEEKAVVLRVKFKLKKGDPEELRAKSMELMRDRNKHQPIGKPSCGCMFKNSGGVSAGKLIDEAGLKGVRVGGMSVSQTHANFMVNDGTGKAADVLELMNRVKKRVKEKFGVDLIPEIFMVGEFSHKPEEFNC